MSRPPLRLLVDACLTPRIVPALAGRFGGQVDAVHLDTLGVPGMADRDVFTLAKSEDRIIVTANGGDFLRLARASEHPGIVVVTDQDTRDRQIAALLRVAAALLARRNESRPVRHHIFVLARGGRLVEVRRSRTRGTE